MLISSVLKKWPLDYNQNYQNQNISFQTFIKKRRINTASMILSYQWGKALAQQHKMYLMRANFWFKTPWPYCTLKGQMPGGISNGRMRKTEQHSKACKIQHNSIASSRIANVIRMYVGHNLTPFPPFVFLVIKQCKCYFYQVFLKRYNFVCT